MEISTSDSPILFRHISYTAFIIKKISKTNFKEHQLRRNLTFIWSDFLLREGKAEVKLV